MKTGLTALLLCAALSTPATAATFAPDPVSASGLTLQIEEVARVQPADTTNNIASPTAIEGDLYSIDQRGRILRQTGTGFEEVLGPTTYPAGLTPTGNEAVLNMAGRGAQVYVAFESTTLPTGLSASPLPDDPTYQTGRFEVIYTYTRNPDGSLSDPTPIKAFENAPGGHTGGGMLVLPDGRLVYARGDNLRADRDGLSAPQDDSSTVGRLLLIAPDGATEVAAKGVRNVQRLAFTDSSNTKIAFADIGAETAEEINLLTTADLIDTTTIENFGWGRNADGNAREGSFFINDGATSNPGTRPIAIAEAPLIDPGFLQPYAQFGAEGAARFAASGPVGSDQFIQIDLLFGDLVSGSLFATLKGAAGSLNDVFHVGLVDANGVPLTLSSLNGGDRVDARFFNFTDGSAGVLLEKTGQLFRLTEIVSPVPLPAPALLLATGLALLLRRKRP